MKVAMRKMSLPIKKMMNQHLKSNKILQEHTNQDNYGSKDN